jgi:hypothetical protein
MISVLHLILMLGSKAFEILICSGCVGDLISRTQHTSAKNPVQVHGTLKDQHLLDLHPSKTGLFEYTA